MKKRLILATVLVSLILFGGVGYGQAQGPVDPEDNAVFTVQPTGGDVSGNLSAAFTYQGQLKKDSAPVNGTCDFQFSLYDRSSTTTPVQLGTTETQSNVAVNNGLFTVVLNFSGQFGADAFNGQGRALGIKVRCPAGSGSYVDLTASSRQPLWAAPFASTLRPGSKIYGSLATGNDIVTIANTGTGRGLLVTSTSDTALWAYNSGSGIGADVRSASGTALSVGGTGKIYSVADSVLYLSPHTMVSRNSPNVEISALIGGGAHIVLPASTTSYVSIPMSAFGTLFGSQLYVKSLELCYKTTGTTIDAVAVVKNSGTESGETYYILNATDRSSGTRVCEPFDATTRSVVDNSSWVQLNLRTASGGPREVWVYTVEVTLTEKSSD